MSYDFSVVLIVPIERQDAANLLACALGYDELPGHTFGRPLSATGAAPATHLGCHTWAEQALLDMLTAFATDGTLPPGAWADVGLTESEARDVITALRVKVGSTPLVTWVEALDENGLQVIEDSAVTPPDPEPDPSPFVLLI